MITPDQEIDRSLVPSSYDSSVQELESVYEDIDSSNKDTIDQNTGIYSDSPLNLTTAVEDRKDTAGVVTEDLCIDDDSILKSKTESFASVDAESENQASRSVYLESSFECIPDGMVTPLGEASFQPESLANGLPLNLRQLRQKFRTPTLPPRREPQRKRSKGSEEELSDQDESSDEGEMGDLEGARKWIPPKTIKRPQSVSDCDLHN